MKKSTKILLALATLWPFVYMILFFVMIFSMVMFMPTQSGEESEAPTFILIIFPLHLLTMLWIMALTVFYIVNVFRNDRVDKDKKALWAVVILLGNMIAMPVYWYLYIWREPSVASVTPPSLGTGSASGWVNEATTSQRNEYVPPPQPPNWRE
jgi:hypothetical protein